MSRLATVVLTRAVRLFLHLSFRVMGFACLKIGDCSFWVPPSFSQQCKDATARISEIDPTIYNRVTQQPFVFWYHKETVSDDRLNKMFSIPEPYLAWKGLGVIARVVYAYFLVETFRGDSYVNKEPPDLHNLARSSTAAWLLKHGFPRELQEPFEELVSTN